MLSAHIHLLLFFSVSLSGPLISFSFSFAASTAFEKFSKAPEPQRESKTHASKPECKKNILEARTCRTGQGAAKANKVTQSEARKWQCQTGLGTATKQDKTRQDKTGQAHACLVIREKKNNTRMQNAIQAAACRHCTLHAARCTLHTARMGCTQQAKTFPKRHWGAATPLDRWIHHGLTTICFATSGTGGGARPHKPGLSLGVLSVSASL